MNNLNRIKRLIKKANEENVAAWQEVFDAVSSPELPPGIIDEDVIKETEEAVGEIMSKMGEAQKSVDSMSPEEKANLAEGVQDPNFLEQAKNAEGKVAASLLMDTLFVKIASKYFGKKDATKIIREINTYKNLYTSNIKIASQNSPERILLEKEAAMMLMFSDENYLKSSDLVKISAKYSSGLIKNAEGGTSIWQSVKNIGSEVASIGGKALSGVGSGIASVGRGIKSTFKFLWKYLPFIGVIWAAYDGYKAYQNSQKSLEGIRQHFSDLGSEDSIISPDYIKKLIEKFKNSPERLLRVTNLNKVAGFYAKNILKLWYSVAWFISDLITSVGIVLTAATGGALAPVFVIIATVLGVGSAAGIISLSWFDTGIKDFISNSHEISSICVSHLEGRESENLSEEKSDLMASNRSGGNMTDEQAMAEYNKFMNSLNYA
jgi:hypothetical protein